MGEKNLPWEQSLSKSGVNGRTWGGSGLGFGYLSFTLMDSGPCRSCHKYLL